MHALNMLFFSFLDSNLQPKFYCLLSPEASEEDISRLDSNVRQLQYNDDINSYTGKMFSPVLFT